MQSVWISPGAPSLISHQLSSFIGTEKPDCADDDSSLCGKVWDLTHKGWLAASSDWLIAKPAAVIGILLVAFVIRWLVHRAIRRITRSTAEGKTPTVLRPLKERTPAAFQEVTGLLSERRQQRAAAIGSILGSISSVLIFGIAFMLILDELGINLAPLLASAGIAGIALGFGAQSVVKDVLSGIFMLLEDQYGVGDIVDLGEASGTVESVGLRITTIRDVHGVVWHVRNGEVVRVGNKSQGWAVVNVDVPLPFGTAVDQVTTVISHAISGLSADPDWQADLLTEPEVLGVEQMTPTGMLLRVTLKTTSAAQWRIAREMRARIGAALDEAGISYGFPAPPGPAT